MSIQAVLLPVFVQVALTFGLLLWMGHLRVGAVRRGEVHARRVALRQPNWPPRTQQVANAFHNQLELPLLFYVLTILAWITRQADLLFIVMAWILVASRLAHAAIHVTSNDVTRRWFAFTFGAAVLILMWLIFAVRILLALA